MAATYRFEVEDDALRVRVNSRRWERLRPLVRDEFTPERRDPHDQRFFRFSRMAEGTIDGFSVGFWRVGGVRFTKQGRVPMEGAGASEQSNTEVRETLRSAPGRP